MKSFFKWLSTPYYYNPSTKFKIKVSLVFGLFVFFFLFVFKPFFIALLLKNLLLEYAAGVAFINVLGVFSILYLSPILFKKYFSEDRWTIGKNLFLISIGFICVSYCIWYFSITYISVSNLESISLLTFIGYCFLVGCLPLFFFVFYNEQIIRIKREQRAIQLNALKRKHKKKKKVKLANEVIISSENKKEQLFLDINQLIYITSEGNYVSFFIKNDENKIQEKILRTTLAKTFLALEKYNTIIRCHKSYIVNSSFIHEVSGNARGYLLSLKGIDFKIPVSRKFSKQFLLSLVN